MVLLTLLSVAQAQSWPPGEVLTSAAAIHVTPAGLQSLEDAAPAILPPEIPIDGITQTGDAGLCDYTLELGQAPGDLWLGVDIDSLTVVPTNGTLLINADMSVSINEPSDPFWLYASCGILSFDCDASYVSPFPVSVGMPFSLTVVTELDGTKRIDATLGTITFQQGLQDSDIRIAASGTFGFIDCPASAISTVFGWLGITPVQFLLGFAEPAIDLLIQSQRDELETAIEDALNQARFDDIVDVNGVLLEVLVQPNRVNITPNGLEVVLESAFHADQAECMADVDPGGSIRTDTPLPAITSHPGGTQTIVLASDDMGNQALYALWRGGLFCVDVGETVDIGLPINSSLLGIIGGEAYDTLVPETKPLALVVNSTAQPEVQWGGTYDAGLVTDDLWLDMYTEIDYRQARAIGVKVVLDSGADLNFSGTTGVLDLDLGLEPGTDIVIDAAFVELVPESGPTIEENFTGILEVVLDQLVGDALSTLAFPLPSLEGVGLQSLVAAPTGTGADWLGVSAAVGPVGYENGGCDGSGCDSNTGCTGGGCSTTTTARLWLFLFGLGLVAARRRA